MKQLCLLLLTSIILYISCAPSPTPSTPISNHLILENEAIQLKVAPDTGGRIASLQYAGVELLSQLRDENHWYWGSMVWPSPQADWSWPPPAKVDQEAYEVVEQTATSIILKSQKNAFKNIQVTKDIRLVDAQTIQLNYSFYNTGDTTIRVGIWENSRIDYIGHVTWATGSSITDTIIGLEQQDSLSTLHFVGHKKPGKLFIHSMGGWVRYQKDKVTLTKNFAAIPKEQIAPEQAAIEIYFDPINRFAEIEEHGPYVAIAPKRNSSLEITWILEKQ